MGIAPAQPRSRIASVVGQIVALGAPFVLPLLPGQANQRVTDVRQDTTIVVFEWRVATAVLAIVSEELLIRAYAIERLTLFTGNLWVGGLVSVVLFALAHVPRYGFSAALAAVAIIAAVLSALYLWTRNFWVCATMHATIDCLGLVVGPALATHGVR